MGREGMGWDEVAEVTTIATKLHVFWLFVGVSWLKAGGWLMDWLMMDALRIFIVPLYVKRSFQDLFSLASHTSIVPDRTTWKMYRICTRSQKSPQEPPVWGNYQEAWPVVPHKLNNRTLRNE
jgi:hypothetical protein